MTLYGYARVSVREPEDKNLDLQVERLVRAGCAMGNFRAEEASGAKDDRSGLLELLDLVVQGDTLVVTHIDRLSRGLTYGLQVIEGLHRTGVEFRSLAEDFDTATSTSKLPLSMVLAFSEWWRNSIRDRSVAGQAKARAEGRGPFPWPEAQPDRAATGVHPGGAVEGSEPTGTGQAPGRQSLDHPTGGRVGVGWAMQPLHGAWAVGSLTQLRSQNPAGERPNAPAAPPRIIAIPIRSSLPPSNGSPADNIQFPSLPCSQLRYSEQSHSSAATGSSARLAPWLPRRSATRLPSPPIRQ